MSETPGIYFIKKNIKCDCGNDLMLHIAHTGADWKCEEGEGSGFGYEVSLDCDQCGRIYPLGNIKKRRDFIPVIDEMKIARNDNGDIKSRIR